MKNRQKPDYRNLELKNRQKPDYRNLELKNRHKPDYRSLERKIYVKIALITVSALVAVLLLRSLSSGVMGDFIVAVLRKIFSMTLSDALNFYHFNIRKNLDYIIFATIAVFFIILSRFLLSQFSKYFNEISNGLDVLVEDKGGDIKLSPEMATMEGRIKTIKQTLEVREHEARLADQHKNDVVMYLAHDIKTPLTSVIGYLSLLDEAPGMPPEQRAKYVNITLEKAYRLEKLVDEFFEITRYNFQTDSLTKENIDLYYMLAQMADEFYPLLTTMGKHVVLSVPEEMAVYGDPDKLARVFNNVLKNAVAYSPDDSVITIAAFYSGDMISIVFKNAGSIPEDKLAAIFDKFYRLDSARSSDTGGAGLGLAISKEIVVSHGGRIYADSADGYTTFVVELPVMWDIDVSSSHSISVG